MSMLDEYNYLGQEKDEEKRRLRIRNTCFTTYLTLLVSGSYATFHTAFQECL